MTLSLLRLLITRLERITPDSVWAHRASGLRGALLTSLEQMTSGLPMDESRLRSLAQAAFTILEQATREKQAPPPHTPTNEDVVPSPRPRS